MFHMNITKPQLQTNEAQLLVLLVTVAYSAG